MGTSLRDKWELDSPPGTAHCSAMSSLASLGFRLSRSPTERPDKSTPSIFSANFLMRRTRIDFAVRTNRYVQSVRPPEARTAVLFPLRHYPVPTTPVRFKVPLHCKSCGAIGSVSPETTIERGLVRLTWCCRSCGYEWPITQGEEERLRRRHRGTGDDPANL